MQHVGNDLDTFQRTLKADINCTGIGLHSAAHVHMQLRAAAPNTGIRFRRTDVKDANPEIIARWDAVSATAYSTTLRNDDGVTVSTVEHLMAALAGCAIDNAVIELDGAEVPVMDGSSAPFVFLIECAGIIEQAAPRRAVRVLKTVEVGDGDRYCTLSPSDGFSVSFEIDFDSTVVNRKSGFFDLHNGGFRRHICRARTFGFQQDVQKLWDQGLALGGSLENAVVVGADDSILNDEGLRYEDEFLRHKVLDSVGDLYLAGAPLLAHFHGQCSGHSLNNRLLRRLFADAAAWEYCDDAAVPVTVPTGVANAAPARASA